MGKDLSTLHADLDAYVVSLECAKAGCESRVILLAPVPTVAREDEFWKQMQTNWSNHSSVCKDGHPPIHPPLQIAGGQRVS